MKFHVKIIFLYDTLFTMDVVTTQRIILQGTHNNNVIILLHRNKHIYYKYNYYIKNIDIDFFL